MNVVGFGAVTCPPNDTAPAGFVVWNGPVPPELTQWAMMLRDRIGAYPYGQLFSTRFGTVDVLARKDHHTFTYRKQPDGSTLLSKDICIPGITLYRPSSPPGVSGLGATDVLDPATAAPDPSLALYSGEPPQESWVGPVLAGIALGAAGVGVLWWARK